MPDPVTAIASSSVASIGGSILGGRSSREAASDASDAEAAMNSKNIAFQKWMFDRQREDQEPWRKAGIGALDRLEVGMKSGAYDVDPFSLGKDPGYKFRLAEGTKAVDNMMAGGNKFFSGARGKALSRFNQGLASEEYGNAFARSNNKFNRDATLAGVGQTAVNAVQNAGSRMASNVGNSMTATGRAQAQGYLNQGNADRNMYGGMATGANQGIENYLLYKAA